MGHALRPREQRGGRARGQSPSEAGPGGRGAAVGDGPGRGLHAPAGDGVHGGPPRGLILPAAALHPAAALFFILIGLLLRLGHVPEAGWLTWTGGLVLTGAPVVWRTLRGIAPGRFAADLVAMLAIVSALPLGQPLAGLIVVLMQTGGEALERYAEGRASEAVRALEAAAPRTAHRVRAGVAEEIPADAVAVG